MADPAQRDEDPAAGADQAVKIERLLLTGLDLYFNGRFERAIDVWTRVLFLDRHHARARVYIDRARAAIAERLRESEVYLHAGVEACDRGDVSAARALLTTAIERGGAHDEMLAALHRVERLEAARDPASPERRRAWARRARRGPAVSAPPRRRGRLPKALWIVMCVGVGAALAVAGVWLQLDPATLGHRGIAGSTAPEVGPSRLPVPSVAELALERATAALAEGRHAEALGQLEIVGLGDRLRGEVDTLRANIQREIVTARPAGRGRLSP